SSISETDKVLVAVNVEPFPDQLVGSMHYGVNKNNERVTSNAWQFPIRKGKHNICITPNEIPMFLDPQVRRVAIRLSQIPAHAQTRLVWRNPTNLYHETPVTDQIDGVKVDL